MKYCAFFLLGVTLPFLLVQAADPSLLDQYRALVKARAALAAERQALELEIAAEKNTPPAYMTVDLKSATVKIRIQDSGGSVTGSAFILECAEKLNADGTRNCLVATVAHAFRNAGIGDPNVDLKKTPIQVQFSDKGRILNSSAPGTFIGASLQGDVDVAYVVIRVPEAMVVPTVPLVPFNYRAAPNQPVVQYGYPNETLVAEVNRRSIVSTTANRYLICTGYSALGNSGGLLINSQGSAIGIASASGQSGNPECQFTSFKEMYGLAADPAVARDLAKYGLGGVFKK